MQKQNSVREAIVNLQAVKERLIANTDKAIARAERDVAAAKALLDAQLVEVKRSACAIRDERIKALDNQMQEVAVVGVQVALGARLCQPDPAVDPLSPSFALSIAHRAQPASKLCYSEWTPREVAHDRVEIVFDAERYLACVSSVFDLRLSGLCRLRSFIEGEGI